MRNTITVFEHGALRFHDHGFSQQDIQALLRYNEVHGQQYFTLGYNHIRFKSYVGVIQVGRKMIEILPKADHLPESAESTKNKWQAALVYMLQRAGYLKLSETDRSSQKTSPQPLLDIYLYAYLEAVQQLVHFGLVKKYHRVQQQQRALKGRLLFQHQFSVNLVHKERFYTDHQVYDRDNVFNAVLKRALEVIANHSNNYTLRQDASKHLLYFQDISSWRGQPEQLRGIQTDRKTEGYTYALELARMIIKQYSPSMQIGEQPVLAILFDMNRLFEQFVYRQFLLHQSAYASSSLSISGQQYRPFWKHKTLRPDILLAFTRDSKHYRVIIDTKWKKITSDNPSDDDLKQMFAYNLQFGSVRSILFYPYCGLNNEGEHYYASSQYLSVAHSCELYFADFFAADGKISDAFVHTFLNYVIEGKKTVSS